MEKIRELIDRLNMYTEAYDKGTPLISDREWDDLYFQLTKMENETGLYYEDSPTQKIHFKEVSKLDKVTHSHLMLSLAKTKEIGEVKSFLGDKAYICMGKMDGLTCSLTYRGGKLIGAETRGNGIVGEDILHNAYVIKNIPKRIPWQDEFIVDGEIICTYDNFEPFSNEYKNPRNFASGSIRLLDSRECSKRNLTFVAWDIIGFTMKLLSTKMELLKEYGFTTVPYTIDDDFYTSTLEEQIEKVKKECADLSYPIDGVVFKYDFCRAYEEAGRTDHHFKGGLAYKFYDEEYETTIEGIEWTMGRTGVLTPVAMLAPIDIDGTEVSRANIHNITVAHETLGGLCFGWKGQKVWVYKANMIIPQISRAEEDDERTKEYFTLPYVCPVCGGEVEIRKEVDSEMLYCANPQCEGKLVNRIEHFFGKKGLDAKGISKATISKLIDLGWVTRIADVFDLSRYKDEWKALPGFGEKSVSNILGSIDTCRNCDLESAIAGIGIPLIGRTVAKDLAKRFATYAAFKENIEGSFDFSTIGGYGYEMNKALKTFNYEELDYIVENYLNIKEDIKENYEKKLQNLVFCVTGKVSIWKNRDELSAFIESLGGKVTGSVSKNTNYLINNDVNSTSAKNNKAKELGIPIISEQTFMDNFDISK
jgi:DNA ligase (NAD+)